MPPTSTPFLYKGKPPGKIVMPLPSFAGPAHGAEDRLPGGVKYISSWSPVLKILHCPNGFEKGPFENGGSAPGG